MPLHRFTINVPNPSPKAVVATLRLAPARRGGILERLDVPRGKLEVLSVGLTRHPCKKGTQKRMAVKLGPRESVDIHVLAEVGATRADGSATFHVTDERNGRVVGGVTVVCVARSGAQHPGSVVAAPGLCPVKLARDAYVVRPDADPATPTGRSIALGTTVELVVPITNPTAAPLPGVAVYLEHLGTSDATFRPTTWNAGDLSPKETFFAAWEVNATGAAAGAFHASVVALSPKHNPVRLSIPFKLQLDDRGGGDPSPAPQ